MKKKIRVIHHLAKTGGTIISRCLGCMENVTLLSEVHPIDNEILRLIAHPLQQAYFWFNLLSKEEIIAIDQKGFMSFIDTIKLIDQKTVDRHKNLVLRDWSHLDFLGTPFINPSYQLTTNQYLQEDFDILEIATIRHPIDQWLSMQKVPTLRNISISDYLLGYVNFVEACDSMPLFRYEDFTQSPTMIMRSLCHVLQINYDETFIHNWMNYITITGDVKQLNQDTNIFYRPSIYDPDLVRIFREEDNYYKIMEQFDYSSPVSNAEYSRYCDPKGLRPLQLA